MYRKCNGIRPDDSTQYQTLITKAMDSRSNPSNRIDPWVKIVDKWSRPLPSKSKVPLTTIDDDLYIGDDGYDNFDDDEGDYEYANEEANYSLIMKFKFRKISTRCQFIHIFIR